MEIVDQLNYVPSRTLAANPIGKKVGRLTVVGYKHVLENGRGRWKTVCRCDCGNEVVTRIGVSSKSCGCLLSDWTSSMGKKYGGKNTVLPLGEASFRFLRREYVANAKAKGLEFDLSDAEFRSLTSSGCHYCGVAPFKRVGLKCFNGDYVYNGIDRIDSSRGYTKDNVVPCCTTCNIAKQRMTPDEFLTWAERVVKHSKVTKLPRNIPL